VGPRYAGVGIRCFQRHRSLQTGHLSEGVAVGAAGFLAKALADMGPRRALQREGEHILVKSGLPPQPPGLASRLLGIGSSALAGSAAVQPADMVDMPAPGIGDMLAPSNGP
jgi:hypothetical protein